MNTLKESFVSSKISSNELSQIQGGKRIYVGGTTDCDTGETTVTWHSYNVFGKYKGQGVDTDQV